MEIRPQAAADPTGGILAVASDDGIVLRVQAWSADDGNGRRPFVLLHGIASNARTWDGEARRLAAAGCTAYAVDFRGHGISDCPATDYDLEIVLPDARAEWLTSDHDIHADRPSEVADLLVDSFAGP